MLKVIADPYWLMAVAFAALVFMTGCTPAPQPQNNDAPAHVVAKDDPLVRLELSKMQKLLDRLGYPTHDAPGVIGYNTRTAIMTYQAAKGLPTDGTATEYLISLLEADARRGRIIAETRPVTRKVTTPKPVVVASSTVSPALTPPPVIIRRTKETERPEADRPDVDRDDSDHGGGQTSSVN